MARKPKERTNKPVKAQTVKEFKAWLSGILEFQSDDWSPNAEQWRTIQERISLLQDEVVVEKQVAKEVPVTQRMEGVSAPQPVRQPLLTSPTGESITLLPEGDGPAEHLMIPDQQPIPGIMPNIENVSSRVVASNIPTIPASKFISQDPKKSKFL